MCQRKRCSAPDGSAARKVVAALCLATDLGMGFPFEHGLHTTHADERVGEVDVAPAQGNELAAPQAGDGRREEDRRVLLRRRRAYQRKHLLGREDVEVDASWLAEAVDVGD